MADNVTANPGTGGPVFATDDISGVHYPLEKLVFGPLDTATVVDDATTKRLPVNAIADDLSAQYHIKKTNLDSVASFNFAFGFTSRRVRIRADAANTADVAIDFLGGTAVFPAPNAAGHRVLSPGEEMNLDHFCVASLSAIAASGTQTLIVSAFK